MKFPKGYPDEVVDYLMEVLGQDCRDDFVVITKAGFGLPESPPLWYLEYKDCIQELGLEEMKLIPGVFRAFHPPPRRRLRAMASIHVDDTRSAGDETADELWTKLRARLKFGRHRKATDGWVKFCGRWERQDPETYEMEYSMDEYVKDIPYAKVMMGPTSTAAPSTSSAASTSTSTARGGVFEDIGTGGPAGVVMTEAPSTSASSTSTSTPEGSQESDLWDYLQARVVQTLSDGQKKVISSLVGQLNWAAIQGRYDLAYVASLVQQLAGQGRRDALRWLNLRIKRAQESLNVKVRHLGCELEELIVISASDAAYGAIPGGHSQGADLVLLGHPRVLLGVAPICILEGK